MITQDDVIYFVITDRFANGDPDNDYDVDLTQPGTWHGGDFAGIIDRIPYLQQLGVTAIWITPVFEQIRDSGFWGKPYHGYWPLDFEKVDPHLYSPKPGIPYGSRRYLKEFVDQVHAAGIKVILDVVVNHTGYDHPGMEHDDVGPIKPHWFTPYQTLEDGGDKGGWLGGLPDLDQNKSEVADYFANMLADWIADTGVDALRFDAIRHVSDLLWHYCSTVIKGRYPEVTLIGEVLHHDIGTVSAYQNNFVFDSVFDFPLQNAIWEVFIYGHSFHRISSPYSKPQEPGSGVLDQDIVYTNHNALVTLIDNHDLPGGRFLTAALTHADGNYGWAHTTTKLALTFLLTTRGIPQIYYGTELGLEGGLDPDNRRDMPWHLLARDGVEPSASNEAAHDFWQHTHQLVQLRRSSQSLRYGSQITLHVDDRLIVYLREYRNEWMIIAIYLGDEAMPFPVTVDLREHSVIPPRLLELMMAQQFVDIYRHITSNIASDGRIQIQLPPRSASILMPVRQMLVSVR